MKRSGLDGRLLRLVVPASALVMTSALLITLWLATEVARHSIVETTQAANVTLTQAFVNQAWARLRADYASLRDSPPNRLRHRPELARIEAEVRAFSRNTDVLKLKIYDIHGHTIYSSDPRQLGEDQSGNRGFQAALAGLATSGLEFEGHTSSFDNEVFLRNAVASYLPVWGGSTEPEAVVEVYTDRTAAIARVDRAVVLLAVVLTPLFFVATVGLIVVVQLYERSCLRQEAQERARQAAETADLAKTRFLANMSHEIRTPMNAIIGLTHLALDTELSGKQRDYLGKIQGSSQTLLRIVNEILDFSKIETANVALESIEFGLASVLRLVAEGIEQRAAEKGLEFAVRMAPDIPDTLIGDPLRLNQVLTNLAGNAVKFTQRGEVTLDITATHPSADKVVITFVVRDTGIGMSKEEIGRAFQSFMQADASTTRHYGGTGLGLPISRRLVEIMGGTIEVDSTPGLGSAFHVTLPFAIGAMTTEGLPFSADQVIAVVGEPGASRAAAAAAVARLGGQVIAVQSANALAARPAVAVVLADKPAKLQQALDCLPDVPILVVAANPDRLAGMTAPGRRLGFARKPVTPSTVLDAIQELMRRGSAAPPRRLAADGGMTLPGVRALLVEDNPTNRQVAQELLAKIGIDVAVAADGHEALRWLEDHAVDIVLMDLQMPGMDGFEAARMIRRQKRFAALPIIALTAHATVDDRERCLEAGMNGHVSKPIAPDVLATALTRWVGTAAMAGAGRLGDKTPAPPVPPLPRFVADTARHGMVQLTALLSAGDADALPMADRVEKMFTTTAFHDEACRLRAQVHRFDFDEALLTACRLASHLE